MDLLPQNIQSHWNLLPETVRSILGWPKMDLKNIWVCFNIQNINDIFFPENTDKVVITYHTEYIKHVDLIDFFVRHKHTQFLFLCDWNRDTGGLPWPENVSCVKWITWHTQLNNIIKEHGINTEVTRPKHKVSSLSFRHEFHKAAVTAYLLKTFPPADMVLSWWNQRSQGRLYYLDHDYYIPENIADIVLDQCFQDISSIELDEFTNSAMANSDWSHPAYLDCLFNCTNESVYNDFCVVNGDTFALPQPYLTEKTWKPLLAGRNIVPVSQHGSLGALQDLGLQFIPEIIKLDQIDHEFDRMTTIWGILDWINTANLSDLFDYTYDSVCHNIRHIKDGDFFSCCDSQNRNVINDVQSWAL